MGTSPSPCGGGSGVDSVRSAVSPTAGRPTACVPSSGSTGWPPSGSSGTGKPAPAVTVASAGCWIWPGEVLAGTAQLEQAEREVDRFELVADDLLGPGGPLRAGLAGLAAAKLVSLVLWGDYGEDVAADADDEDLDSDAWETDFLASLAESSTPDQPDYDPEARRAFWRWYLREAIPSIDAG
jgi:hypothetical protein